MELRSTCIVTHTHTHYWRQGEIKERAGQSWAYKLPVSRGQASVTTCQPQFSFSKAQGKVPCLYYIYISMVILQYPKNYLLWILLTEKKLYGSKSTSVSRVWNSWSHMVPGDQCAPLPKGNHVLLVTISAPNVNSVRLDESSPSCPVQRQQTRSVHRSLSVQF